MNCLFDTGRLSPRVDRTLGSGLTGQGDESSSCDPPLPYPVPIGQNTLKLSLVRGFFALFDRLSKVEPRFLHGRGEVGVAQGPEREPVPLAGMKADTAGS